jgi:hypothetical protein
MIDIGKILKRAWFILWNYKILWIFGVFLALTTGGTSSGGGSGSGYRFSNTQNNNTNFNPGPFWTSVNDWFQLNIKPLFTQPIAHLSTFIWIGVALLLLCVVVGILMAFLRYTSETAVIRMVDDYEQSGVKLGFRQGWKLGWSRRAFRLWLIDLIISLPVIVFMLFLGLLGLWVYFSVRNGGVPGVAGSIAAFGCFFLFVILLVIVMIALALLRPFFARSATLEDLGVGASFRRGWQMVRANWKSAALLWLVVVGLSIGYGIVSIILVIMLIPVFIITGTAGLIVAAIPALAAFGVASFFASGPLIWIIAAFIALPFFLVITFSPLLLVGGWAEIFISSLWTLAYREMKALEIGNLPIAPVKVD